MLAPRDVGPFVSELGTLLAVGILGVMAVSIAGSGVRLRTVSLVVVRRQQRDVVRLGLTGALVEVLARPGETRRLILEQKGRCTRLSVDGADGKTIPAPPAGPTSCVLPLEALARCSGGEGPRATSPAEGAAGSPRDGAASGRNPDPPTPVRFALLIARTHGA